MNQSAVEQCEGSGEGITVPGCGVSNEGITVPGLPEYFQVEGVNSRGIVSVRVEGSRLQEIFEVIGDHVDSICCAVRGSLAVQLNVGKSQPVGLIYVNDTKYPDSWRDDGLTSTAY